MATQYAFGKIVTNGLVLALDAADQNSYTSGSTTWKDLSGNGNSGSIQPGCTYTSQNLGGIGTSGSYIALNTSSNLRLDKSDFTIISAITFTSTPPSYVTFFYQGYGNGAFANSSFQFGRYTDSGTLEINFYGPQAIYNFGAGSFTSGSTFIAACTFISSSQSVTFFNNGIFSNQIAAGSNFAMTSFDYAQIGRRYSGGPGYNDLLGNVYLTQVYNRALSKAEILQNYNAQKSRFGLT
jgi:hypothetical protein